MAEFLVVCFMIMSLSTNFVLAWMMIQLLRDRLRVQIVASDLPAGEKVVLLDKTADQVAERQHDRPRRRDITPMMG